MFDTWQLTCYHLILDICYHLVPIYLTWYCDIWLNSITPDTCITLHIMIITFMGTLTWLLYCYQTSGTPVLLNSWTPVSPVLKSPALLLLLIAQSYRRPQSMPGVRMTRMYLTIVLASGGSWMELSTTLSKVPRHTWWGPPLESVEGTSRIHSPHRTKCHMEQSAIPHTWWGPPLESVGATSWICGATSWIYPPKKIFLPPACAAWC